MDTRNQESWASLQESESGSEELLNNAESFAAYLALELNDSGDNQVRYSRENVGELSYGISLPEFMIIIFITLVLDLGSNLYIYIYIYAILFINSYRTKHMFCSR